MVVPPGLTLKLAPLALDPIETPPVATVYHRIVFPADVAFKLELPPQDTVAGVAVTAVGAAKLPGVQVNVKPDAGTLADWRFTVTAFVPPATVVFQFAPDDRLLKEALFAPLKPT